MQIPLSSPDITSRERDYVLAVLNTPHLSLGPLLPRFETEFAKRLGVKHAVAVNSGTSGLHLAVKGSGYWRRGFCNHNPVQLCGVCQLSALRKSTPRLCRHRSNHVEY